MCSFSYFYCGYYSFTLRRVHGLSWRFMPLHRFPSLQWLQSIVPHCSKEKKMRTNIILYVHLKIHFKEHEWLWPLPLGLQQLVIFYLTPFWSTLLPPSSHKNFTQCQNTRKKGEILRYFMIFVTKKSIQLKCKLSLSLIFKPYFFTSNSFTNLGHHATIKCQWEHHAPKLVVQNDSAHNNQLVMNVSVLYFSSIKSALSRKIVHIL